MKTGIRVISVLLAVLLVSVVVVPVSAEEMNVALNNNRMEVINDLRGQDITLGEFYEKVMPEEFSELPEEVKAELYETKKVWLEMPKIGDKVQYNPAKTSKLETTFREMQTRSIVILMYHVSEIAASGRSIDYRSESWVVFPPYLKLPYGEITSALCKMDPDEQTGTIIDWDTESEEGVYNLKVEVSKTVTESGDYFTDGCHAFDAPPGYALSPSFTNTQSEIIHVS